MSLYAVALAVAVAELTETMLVGSPVMPVKLPPESPPRIDEISLRMPDGSSLKMPDGIEETMPDGISLSALEGIESRTLVGIAVFVLPKGMPPERADPEPAQSEEPPKPCSPPP